MTTILTYHHVSDPPPGTDSPNLYVSPARFESQMAHLKSSGYTAVSLDQLRTALRGEGSVPDRSVVITFDDGYEDNHANALPILKKHGLTAAFFIMTGRIGGADKTSSKYMAPFQLRELDAAGMTIGSHTVTHPWLARIPIAEARREMTDSKSALEAFIGKPVRWLCYPSGSFNREVAHAAEEFGYSGACSVIRDNRVSADQLFYLPRVMVMNDTTPLRFRYFFSGLYHFLHARKNRKRWKEYV